MLIPKLKFPWIIFLIMKGKAILKMEKKTREFLCDLQMEKEILLELNTAQLKGKN